ncbi:MAG: extensin family protein [Myxococcales bacterium]
MNGRAAFLVLFACSVLGLGGCAHEAPEASYPYAAGAGWVVPASYAWPPKSVTGSASGTAGAASSKGGAHVGQSPALSGTASKSAPSAPTSIFAKTLGDVPRPRTRNELRSVLPGSGDCLARLAEHSVHFRTVEREIGVKTPIIVDGPIEGIRFNSGSGPLVADCRLVLALALVAPTLTSYGVSDIRFSGAYVYRLSNKGRVSLHAYGLAIDLHGFTRLGTHYEVQHDFHKGIGLTTAEDAPIANGFASRLRMSGLFHEYLTPDDNADHYDHVHVGVSPLPDEVM